MLLQTGLSRAREIQEPERWSLRDEYISQEENKIKAAKAAIGSCNSAYEKVRTMDRYGENGELVYSLDNRAGVWELIRSKTGRCELSKTYELGEERIVSYGPPRNKRKAVVMLWLEGSSLCSYRKRSNQSVVTLTCYSKLP